MSNINAVSHQSSEQKSGIRLPETEDYIKSREHHKRDVAARGIDVEYPSIFPGCSLHQVKNATYSLLNHWDDSTDIQREYDSLSEEVTRLANEIRAAKASGVPQEQLNQMVAVFKPKATRAVELGDKLEKLAAAVESRYTSITGKRLE
jgi:hypothetical protein